MHQDFRKVEVEISDALMKIRTARTISELNRAMAVHIPTMLRGMRGSIPGLNSVRVQAEEKGKKIVSELIKQIKETTDSGQKATLVSRTRSEIELLRGDLGALYQKSLEQLRHAANGL